MTGDLFLEWVALANDREPEMAARSSISRSLEDLGQMRQAAPVSFAPPAETLDPARDLVVEGDSFRWEKGKGTYTPVPVYVPATTPPAAAPAKKKRASPAASSPAAPAGAGSR
jgi:hypothetical protein